VDANLIKAVMKLESNGEWIISHAGAIGYMQVVPKYWGHLDFDLNDPAENIMAGATVLKYYLDKNGGNVYEALRGYHGYGFDGFTTDRQYADVIMGNLQELRSAGGGSSGYTGTGSGWSVMFGGQAPNITQEMGLNSWSRQHLNGMYAYSPSLGITGHAGIDVGMTYGSSLYAPTGGTVIRSGGSGYYCDDSGCGPGQGELRIQLDNGDEIIIGHMSSISVKVGQRVNAGMFVGRSGSAGSGAHVHIEYRTPDRSTSSGWRVVDPRQALNGQVTAIGGGQAQQSGDPLTSWVNRFFGIGG
jgi:murein DD-endopeptidase MepM/ murein hydrolase activator NlpD